MRNVDKRLDHLRRDALELFRRMNAYADETGNNEDHMLFHGFADEVFQLSCTTSQEGYGDYSEVAPACEPTGRWLLWKLAWRKLLRQEHHRWVYGLDECGSRPARTCECCGAKQAWLTGTKRWGKIV